MRKDKHFEDWQLEFDLYLVGVYLEQLKRCECNAEILKWKESLPKNLRDVVFLRLAIIFCQKCGN